MFLAGTPAGHEERSMPTSDDRTFGPIGTRVLLDNDRVRVWELRLDPGDSSDLHHHALDYLMVQIEGDKVAARFEPDSEGTFAGAEYLDGPVSPGTAIFASAGGRETAINIGEQTFREIIVEVKETVTERPPPRPPRLALGERPRRRAGLLHRRARLRGPPPSRDGHRRQLAQDRERRADPPHRGCGVRRPPRASSGLRDPRHGRRDRATPDTRVSRFPTRSS